MKKTITLVIIIIIAAFLFACGNEIDISEYPLKYHDILKCTEYAVKYSDTAVVAEFISSDENYYKFIVTESIFGNFKTNEELLIYIPESDSPMLNSYEYIESKKPSVPYTEYITEYWYKGNLMVDLIVGEKYLILGEELYPYNGIKRIKQFVMHYEDFSVENIEGFNAENAEAYLTLNEYVKYIDKTKGHGTIEY